MTHQERMRIGAPVFTRDGEQLGEVKEMRGACFKVDAPMQPDYWLRMDHVSTGDAGQVVLNAPKDRLMDYQMADPDEVDVDRGHLTDYRADTAEMPATTGDRMAPADTTGREHLRLHEEQLTAHKRPVEAGEVRIGKEVVEQQQTLTVPVRHEEVVIERRPATGRAEGGAIGEGRQEIRVPVTSEEVEVQKRTVATEDVTASTRAREEQRTMSDTVRREQARVETDGDVPVRGDGLTPRD